MRSKIAFFVAFALALGAGVVVGRLTVRVPSVARSEGGPPSWLADQLNLSESQRRQMDAIWAQARQEIGKTFERRHALDREREQALRNLFGAEQRAAYDRIGEAFHVRFAAADAERERLIRDAESRTRALLDDAQKKKYDVLTKEMHRRPWGPPPHGWPATEPSATKPTTTMGDPGGG